MVRMPCVCVWVPHYSFIYVACIPVRQLSLFRGVIISPLWKVAVVNLKAKTQLFVLKVEQLECCFAQRQKAQQSGLQCHISFVEKDDFCGITTEFQAETARSSLPTLISNISFLYIWLSQNVWFWSTFRNFTRLSNMIKWYLIVSQPFYFKNKKLQILYN